MRFLRCASVLSLGVSLGFSAIADGNAVDQLGGKVNEPAPSISPDLAKAKLNKIYEEKLGGFVTKPGSQKGCIKFVNTQTALSDDDISAVVADLKKQLKHDIASIKGESLSSLPKAEDLTKNGATIAIFVVENDAYPPVLAAPEARWAIVNVGALKQGLKDNVLGKRLLARRARGELLRAFSLVCGGPMSMYQGNIFSASSVAELDSLDVDSVVVDMAQKYEVYLPKVGVTPPYTVTYSRAYTEGWAPEPTNEFQRAVVERIKAKQGSSPTKGLKIEYDPKRGR